MATTSGWVAQVRTLLWKHYLVMKRSPILTFFSILAPFWSIIIASAAYSAIANAPQQQYSNHDDQYNSVNEVYIPPKPLEFSVPNCGVFCSPRFYYAPENEFTKAVMDVVKTNMKLQDESITAFGNQEKLVRGIYNNYKAIDKRPFFAGVIFNETSSGDPPSAAYTILRKPGYSSYSYYDGTALDSASQQMVAFKLQLDAAIIAVRTQKPSAKISARLASFKRPILEEKAGDSSGSSSYYSSST